MLFIKVPPSDNFHTDQKMVRRDHSNKDTVAIVPSFSNKSNVQIDYNSFQNDIVDGALFYFAYNKNRLEPERQALQPPRRCGLRVSLEELC